MAASCGVDFAFFVNIKLVPKRLRSLKQLAKADEESVNSYDIFMNRIGL